MGTTLTGTEIKDTYDSLIKVTDNGPISGTAKYLSDGLGNDSVLALSTAGVGIGNAIPSSFFTSARNLVVGSGTGNNGMTIYSSSSSVGDVAFADAATDPAFYSGLIRYDHSLDAMRIFTASSERMRITSAGNVGIGTSSPSGKLHVAGGDIFLGASYALKFSSTSYMTPENNVSGAEISTAGVFVVKTGSTPAERIRVTTDGLTFNGDTAAANALDDYEEGTWTPTFSGSSTAGTYTTTGVIARYTKIGRQVTAYFIANFSAASGGSGYMVIGGLPFYYATGSGGVVGTIYSSNLSYTADYLSIIPETSGASNNIIIGESTSGGATFVQATDFTTSTNIRIQVTYFV